MKSRGEPMRHIYVTQRAHGDHPAGSRCLASRVGDRLLLEFEDGCTVRLPGNFFIAGVEGPLDPAEQRAERERSELIYLRLFHGFRLVGDP